METFYYLIGHGQDPVNWWQMSNRAIIIFIYAVALYRLAPARAVGNSSVLEIALTVIIASSLSRALTGNSPLLPSLAATFALLVLHVLMSAAAMRSDGFARLVKGRHLQIIDSGTIDWHNMKRAKLSERDLHEQLRLHGISSLGEVAAAYMERNGRVSVFRQSGK